MKSLKVNHEEALGIRDRGIRQTWRVFDDKDIRVDDRLVLIDKVDLHDHNSWEAFGEAVVTSVTEKHVAEVGKADFDAVTADESPEALLHRLQQYQGSSVTLQTPIKIIRFSFLPYRAQPENIVEIPGAGGSLSGVTEAQLYADGGSRGNPGPSASGFVILDPTDRVLVDKGVYLGITTNNQAEYTALKLGLEEALHMQIRKLHVYMDSLLVVNQMKGSFKVKNRDLWPIHEAIKGLLQHFESVSFTHIPRELNKAADAAVNRAMDAHISHDTERNIV